MSANGLRNALHCDAALHTRHDSIEVKQKTRIRSRKLFERSDCG